MRITLKKPDKSIVGEITLDGSKSLSNRALIIRALSGEDFTIQNLSTSKDTTTLQSLLESKAQVYDTGAAGTTFRFMTAFLALQQGTQILTGSERMKKRPIAPLVDALRALGARIDYIEAEGYPPLRIHPSDQITAKSLNISAGTSSQFISALLMIAPTLKHGLRLVLKGPIVSRSYIEMTLRLMAYFGIKHQWEENEIHIPPQAYRGRSYRVEADWSAASYHYALAVFAEKLDLQLNGLGGERIQGDSVLPDLMNSFGIHTKLNESGIRLTKSGTAMVPIFEWDFILCPDIAQTLAVICGGVGVQGLFTGLETLSIKETDRIAALKTELAKVQVWFSKLPSRFSPQSNKEYYMVEGKAVVDETVFLTYEDHRMAMAFAPLAMLGTIHVEEPGVVAKSYVQFWDDLKKLGFLIKEAHLQH